MTIAAGFVHTQGILLAADTEVSGPEWKGQTAKLDHFEYPKGRFAYAMAGASNFALSTIAKIKGRLERTSGAVDVPRVVEHVLDKEYPRLVDKSPWFETEYRPDFWFLFAFRPHGGHYTLYVTDRNAVMPVQNHECIGLGGKSVKPILDSIPLVSEESNFNIAIYALAWAKRHVAGCGGVSCLINLRNSGQVGVFAARNRIDIERLESVFDNFNFRSWRLLMNIVHAGIPEPAFRANLSRFCEEILEERRNLLAPMEAHDRKLAELNPARALEDVKELLLYPTQDP